MKNDFDRLTSTLDMVEERIYELKEISIGITKTKKQREQRQKQTVYPRTIGPL